MKEHQYQTSVYMYQCICMGEKYFKMNVTKLMVFSAHFQNSFNMFIRKICLFLPNLHDQTFNWIDWQKWKQFVKVVFYVHPQHFIRPLKFLPTFLLKTLKVTYFGWFSMTWHFFGVAFFCVCCKTTFINLHTVYLNQYYAVLKISQKQRN